MLLGANNIGLELFPPTHNPHTPRPRPGVFLRPSRSHNLLSPQCSLYAPNNLPRSRRLFSLQNRSSNPRINAITSLDPNVLDTADEYDAQLGSNNGSAYKPLFCIPTLLKDNYDTASLPTTAGSLALAASCPTEDAPVVKALKEAGAIILGKTSLHELALEGIMASSLGGQTINPYDVSRTPGGSSGGTGAAIAASLAVWGTGTDTVNSLRSPASANGLWSLRPSRGLISRTGVVPVSFTQDVLGPIARCVEDLAVALSVMVRANEFDDGGRDNATDAVPEGVKGTNYAMGVGSGPGLKGLRFGLLEGFLNRTSNPETDPVNEAMASMTSFLESPGATIIPITGQIYNSTRLLELHTQRYEFRQLMDDYLSNFSLGGSHPKSLSELYASRGEDFFVLPSQYGFLHAALRSSTSNSTYPALLTQITSLQRTLKSTFEGYKLDAIIYPEQKNLVERLGSPSQSGRNGILAALTGLPVVTVPEGWSSATETARRGVPVGMEVLGREWNEEKLLGIARAIEELGVVEKRMPDWGEEIVASWKGTVPDLKPDRWGTSEEYAVGSLK